MPLVSSRSQNTLRLNLRTKPIGHNKEAMAFEAKLLLKRKILRAILISVLHVQRNLTWALG